MKNLVIKRLACLVALVVMSITDFECTPREEAKDAYIIQSKACLVAYDDAPHQKSCIDYVRNRWTEAGAPPAAKLDGGSHE